MKYKTYPKNFGTMLVPPESDIRTGEWELEVLDVLRTRFWEKEGKVLSWKEDLEPIKEDFRDLHIALERLWKEGTIVKFAKSFHTQSGRPQYVQYYIWED